MTEPEERAADPRRPTSDHLRDDMVMFGAGPHDLRVVRGSWVYYVRVVPRGQGFLGGRGTVPGDGLGLPGDGDVGSLALAVLLVVPLKLVSLAWARRTRRPRAMKVGVVRVPNPSSWEVDRHRVVHRQALARGEDPAPYVSALADRAASGEFAPHG